jgi:putative aldouronate transport system permease protein
MSDENTSTLKKTGVVQRTFTDILKNGELILMSLPVILHVFIFCYLPMFGIIIAFKNFRYDKGIFGSDWVGFDNFKFFFSSPDAFTITRNTILLNILFMAVGTLISVTFALMLNEVKRRAAVKIYQTATFFPYFLSWIVVGFMLFSILNAEHGILNQLLLKVGLQPVDWYTSPQYWPLILLISTVWKGTGVGCVIYYATLMGIDREYYEAAEIDGATKVQMVFKISIPFLIPIITITSLLSIGGIIRADFGLFFFLPRDIGMLYPTTDVIDTYVFRALRRFGDAGMASSVGLFQSLVGFLLVVFSNFTVRKFEKENALF